MAENRIFPYEFAGMDPGFAQFCPISDKEFQQAIRNITGPKPDV